MNQNADWNNKLKADHGLDLTKLKNGGVYSDTAHMLCELVSLPEVNRVFEAGAGISTVVFATICERLDKFLVTLEDKPEWSDITDKYLSDQGLSHRVTSTDSRLENAPTFTEPFDLAWVDGNVFWDPHRMADVGPEDINYYGQFCHRPGGARFYKDNLRDAVVIFDDGEDTNCLTEIRKVIEELGRNPADMFLSNPTRRADRNQLVSLPYAGHPAEALIKDMGHWYPVTDIISRDNKPW